MTASVIDSTDLNEKQKSSTPPEKNSPDKDKKAGLKEKTADSVITGAAPSASGSVRSTGLSDKPYDRYDRIEKPRTAAMEVLVDNNIEKAMKVLKRKLIKEGLFKELKSRRYYEKPSERRKRKHKESIKKIRKEEMRQKRGAFLFS